MEKNNKLKRILLIIFGALLLLILVGPFLVPVPPLEDTVDPHQLADPDSQFVDVDGLEVHYKENGIGEPEFILLHGFGASVFSWRDVLEPIGEFGRTIAYDRPAFGLTERPLPGEWEGDSPYGTDAQVELVIGLMDEMGIEQAVLVGNSAGGTIAAQTAVRHPERVVALILVDAAIYTGGGTTPWIKPLFRTPQMQHLGPLVARFFARNNTSLLEMAYHDTSKITDEVVTGYYKPFQSENWDVGLWGLLLASRGSNVNDQLDQIRMPTLVVTGDDDQVVPTEDSIRLAGELPEADLVVIENCGHLPHEECPQAFMDAVESFVSGLDFEEKTAGQYSRKALLASSKRRRVEFSRP